MNDLISPNAFDKYDGENISFFHFSNDVMEFRNMNRDDHNVYHPDVFDWKGVAQNKVTELQEAIRKAISEGKTKVVCDYEIINGRVIIRNFSMVPCRR